jgi:rhamnulokinase
MGVLAFDLGAGSGRAILGRLHDVRLTIQEVHRFANDPVRLNKHLYWDFLRLFWEVKQGLVKAGQSGCDLHGIAVDSWALDFGLVDRNGELLGNPYHYRDDQSRGMMEQVSESISREELFSRTGIQFMPINTLYHLYAMRQKNSAILEKAENLLMIPDLIRFFLTGQAYTEYTNATTTQLLHHQSRSWDRTIIERLGLPQHIFGEIIPPSTVAGSLLPSVQKELSLPELPVIAVGEHDTASAVVAVPAEAPDFAYVSCGTWSLMGTELASPFINQKSLDGNFSNEGGVGDTYRLLKNIMGLWILQECRRIWSRGDRLLTFAEMVGSARDAKPFQSFIDPDHPSFLHPDHMPAQIKQYCQDTEQPIPQSEGEIVRCILESLAFRYRLVLEQLEELTGIRYSGMHIVGGGSQNTLLCQFTANAIGRPVWAGPVEASAIGNILVQYMALGQINGLQEARAVVKNSFPVIAYEPESTAEWCDAFAAFKRVTKTGSH